VPIKLRPGVTKRARPAPQRLVFPWCSYGLHCRRPPGVRQVGLKVDPLVLHTAPQPFDEDVVAPGSSAVQGQLAAMLQHGVDEFDGCERAALIRIDDVARALAGKGLFDRLLSVNRLRRDRHLGREDLAAGMAPSRRACATR